MKKIATAVFILISIAIGATFIYSAYTKTLPIQSFEYTIVDVTHMPWFFATLLARVLVGFEAALGVSIALHLFGRKKWVLKTALALLLVFSIYLVYLWITQGNNVNCGCFGDQIWMSPSASLLKNAVLILLLLLLIRFHKGLAFKWSWLAETLIFIGLLATVFIYFPVLFEKQAWLGKDHYKLDLSALYAPGKKDAPAIDLNSGKHIIGFFSLGCPHCRKAALKMHIMKEEDPSLPFYMVIVGNDKNFKPFFDETKATNIPYTRLEEEPFKEIVAKRSNGEVIIAIPQIDWVDNGWVEAQPNYIIFSQDEVEKWLKKSSAN
ncbi:MAG: hypothetical protein BGO69_09460 [Bacteroidetes bacterium 46-16]|nr:MAG: hypothetical protein BGO69_09460 [Bacteroidetes bacterium 46-16]